MPLEIKSYLREIERTHAAGNAKKKDRCPHGSKDENVFDIMQGVAVCIMVRKPGRRGGGKEAP